MSMKAVLKDRARRRTVGYDFYNGVWDKPIWLVVRVNEKLRTSLGPVFEVGDVTLARYGRDIPGMPPDVSQIMFAYSFRSGGEAVVRNFDILEDV